MALTVPKFLDRYPEFRPAGVASCATALAEAELEIGPDWGDRRDTAVGLVAAHKIWTSPLGSSMRLDSDGNEREDRYLGEFRLLQRKSILGAVVT